MSEFSQSRVRLHALAAATAVALTTVAGAAFAAEPDGRVHLSTLGLAPAEGYDRFIVKYRDGSDASGRMHAAGAPVGTFNPAGKPVRLGLVRHLSVGGQVVKAEPDDRLFALDLIGFRADQVVDRIADCVHADEDERRHDGDGE